MLAGGLADAQAIRDDPGPPVPAFTQPLCSNEETNLSPHSSIHIPEPGGTRKTLSPFSG